jgi:hypothetical protein
MKIIKVEKRDFDHVVFCHHNFLTFSYILEQSLNHLFYEELKKLKKTFFNMEHEDWRGVMDKEDIDRFFEESTFFKHEEVI